MWYNNIWFKILAVLLACLFWFQAKLQKEYTTQVTLLVVILNLPGGTTPDKLPTQLDVKVKGKGLDILKLRLSSAQAIYNAKDYLASDFIFSPSDCTLDIPEDIHLEVLSLVKKEQQTPGEGVKRLLLPVHVEFENNDAQMLFFEKNYHLQPDKVEIIGKGELLNKVNFIKTKPVRQSDLNQNEFKLKLLPPREDITLATGFVQVNQTPASQTPHLLSNIPIRNPQKLNIFPTTVTLKIRGARDKISALQPDQIAVELNLGEQFNNSIPLIITLPSDLELLDYTPRTVFLK